jgi:site-specific recombinase XerD
MPRQRSLSLYWAIRRYVRQCQGKQLAAKTLRWYTHKLEAFRLFMAHEQHIASVGLVTAVQVQAFLAGLPVRAATAHGYRRALHAFFRWCVQQGYARDNPAQVARTTGPASGGASDGGG